jgi:predicted lipid-binding transport protein (Tim44 family)
LTAEAVVVARPNSVPAASSTTATTVPLSTLAVPEIWTGELIVVLASGLSMMIFALSGIGVAAVAGRVALVGAALALALALTEAEAAALAEALGEPLSSTKVVVLSPPHPASTTAIRTPSPAPNPFMRTELGAL